MPTPTYTPLATIQLNNTSNVTFSNIPTNGTYKDLVLVANMRTSTIGFYYGYVNGATGGNNQVFMRGTGSAAESFVYSNSAYINFGDIGYSDPNSMLIAHFIDYAATNKHKTILATNSSANRAIEIIANRTATTSAISSLFIAFGATATSGTISLYGIAA